MQADEVYFEGRKMYGRGRNLRGDVDEAYDKGETFILCVDELPDDADENDDEHVAFGVDNCKKRGLLGVCQSDSTVI